VHVEAMDIRGMVCWVDYIRLLPPLIHDMHPFEIKQRSFCIMHTSITLHRRISCLERVGNETASACGTIEIRMVCWVGYVRLLPPHI
jgi:hypothetical protein